ncbi:arginine--tRNA ligase [Lignipirellula cremea]|uniref:Arginine--tRNA ligase n=1 Tax=Lignipirellula cremea TaxID=2528010 RepID=A0A518DZD5_9BACT|nr:arginine--tRNA ligase [Lignipirellula cremea]QDU97204.1 Arginine--tRNA ligase [Lignipirellula cremea]
MNILGLLRSRVAAALAKVTEHLDDDPALLASLLDMVRPSQNPQFGDYQVNCAMSLSKRLGQTARETAAAIVEHLDVADFCDPPEIAGPGFINLRLTNAWLQQQLAVAASDDRLGIEPVAQPRTYVVDYSSPNVAKPMHVGHIRSTVIGDSLARILRFLGHKVITDNHLGDWGTQFGMIIYGYKHFRDDNAYEAEPVAELSRLYRQVHALMEYHSNKRGLFDAENRVSAKMEELATHRALLPTGDKKRDSAQKKARHKLEQQVEKLAEDLGHVKEKISKVESDTTLYMLALKHEKIDQAVLEETAKLHQHDPENTALWEQFLPHCRAHIQRVYDRLGVVFDHELGESFYHDQLAGVVEDFEKAGLARESDGAMCVFLDGFDAPMIIRKRDGAFLYATTDLATIDYRVKEWAPDAILYVVDFRQGDHFSKLFAAAKKWRGDSLELRHVSFGTVTDDQGRPFKTRDGVAAGLEGLLDQAVGAAGAVLEESLSDLTAEERAEVADIVGHAAIKYADLSHNRTSDYKFSLEKMIALNGNTATYMQYAYARVQSIFRRGEIDINALRAQAPTILLDEPAERALALEILRFHDALSDVLNDYRPNVLTDYLFEQLAKAYSAFFEKCPVLKVDTPEQKSSRLLLCDLTARTIRQGLELLGIQVVDRM